MEKELVQRMIDLAVKQMDFSYVPYSHFHVGAALLAQDGKLYGGCNIENAAYGPTNCAERTAVFKAVSEGYRKFKRIAIATSGEKISGPCGVCRQVLNEFAPNIEIILINKNGETKEFTLPELLPHSFGPADLT